jgi:hypothetical protein
MLRSSAKFTIQGFMKKIFFKYSINTFYALVVIASPSPCRPSPNIDIMAISFLLGVWQVEVLPILASMGWGHKPMEAKISSKPCSMILKNFYFYIYVPKNVYHTYVMSM